MAHRMRKFPHNRLVRMRGKGIGDAVPHARPLLVLPGIGDVKEAAGKPGCTS